jgi:hypothetical protein
LLISAGSIPATASLFVEGGFSFPDPKYVIAATAFPSCPVLYLMYLTDKSSNHFGIHLAVFLLSIHSHHSAPDLLYERQNEEAAFVALVSNVISWPLPAPEILS